MPDDAQATQGTGRGAAARLAAALARPAVARLGVSVGALAASAAAGLVMALAYVGPRVPELAFVAPAGLAAVLARATCAGGALLAAVFAAVVSVVGLWWVAKVTALGLAGLTVFFVVCFAAMGALVPAALRRTRLPLVVVLPPVWVAQEFARSFVLTGFPWLFLGHALADRTVLIQVADFGGAYAVSFAAAAVASAVAQAARAAVAHGDARARGDAIVAVSAAAALVVFQVAYGLWRLGTVESRDGPRLVLVQGNIDTPRGAESDEAHARLAEEIFEVHAALTRAHAAEGDLVVWSESMIPNYYNDPLDGCAQRWRPRLTELLGSADRQLLSGSNAVGPHPLVGSAAENPGGEYNSAFLIDRDGTILQRYDKVHLVPFGEYVPLAGFPVLSRLTPYAASDIGYVHGDPAQPPVAWGEYRIGILICYEDAFASLARRAVRAGADFLVNLSSEAWFAGTSEIVQHAALSRFRAVENRRALVRCCNVGVTCLIDPRGRVVEMLPGSDLPAGVRGVIAVTVPVPPRDAGVTVYAAVGDLFASLCLAAAAALAVYSAAARRARKTDSGTGS